MISSVAPTQSSTFYAYLITKIGIRNLNNYFETGDLNYCMGQKENLK